MKNSILFLFLLCCFQNFSQRKELVLAKEKNGKTVIFKNYKRVKVTTIEGKSYKGRFRVIDDNTIAIGSVLIPLDAIVKIKQRTLFSQIISKTLLILGTSIIIIGATAGGFAVIIIPFGVLLDIPAILIPSIENPHNSKDWNYQIIEELKQ